MKITDEMLEQIARALCKADGCDPDEYVPFDSAKWVEYMGLARHAFTTAAPFIIEECAKVAMRSSINYSDPYSGRACEHAANAIRALKD